MIYVHVPFCKSFCTYCGFYSEICKGSGTAMQAYADAVCKEIEERREEIIKTSGVNTLYFGGGTPSVLPLGVFRRIVQALPFEGPYDEFTVEMNPDDVTRDFVIGLKELGVNRISLGIQSFDDAILRWMNRRHNAAGAVNAVETIRNCGIENISIDLIFGLPQLTEEGWENTISRALALRPQHISAYQLSVEEDSALEQLIARGKFTEATQEQCRQQYDALCRMLRQAGYNHYEVSNFALPGYEARHNSAYWSRAPYVGLGPGAHSFDGARTRRWNSHMTPGAPCQYIWETESLTDYDVAVERLMLGLRTAAGIDAGELRAITGPCALQDALSKGLLTPAGPQKTALRIPEDRFFVSDDIIRQLI